MSSTAPGRSGLPGRPRNQPSPEPEDVRRFWIRLVRPLTRKHATPFFLFSVRPLQWRLARADRALQGLPVTHWWSAKTLTLPPLWQWWRQQGRGIEVVSEFELRAALVEGFTPEAILVNGPAKQDWLPGFERCGLRVNLDSPAEAAVLLPLAAKYKWQLGLRLAPGVCRSADSRARPGQFGMSLPELRDVLRRARRIGIEPEVLHFHLGTQIPSADWYAAALEEAATLCHQLHWHPQVVDCGGGWPLDGALDPTNRPLARSFSIPAFAQALQRARKSFAHLKEFWLENGRWLAAPAGVLVVRVRDLKTRGTVRYAICDGGRTLHGMVSTWERHDLVVLPERAGRRVPTIVTGPTCMTFDVLAEARLPRGLRAGDHLIWMHAGAYNLSWETRFSHGLAPVLWHDGRVVQQVRPRESFDQWYGRWMLAPADPPKPRSG